MLFAVAFVLAVVGVVVLFVGTILGSFGSANVLSSALSASGYNAIASFVICAFIGQVLRGGPRVENPMTWRGWTALVAGAYLALSILAPVVVFVALLRAESLAAGR